MITPKQLQYLKVIAKHITTHGTPPSMQEIADKMGGVSRSLVHRYMWQLKDRGCINRREGRARFIEITDRGWEALRWKGRATGRCPACNQPLPTNGETHDTTAEPQ